MPAPRRRGVVVYSTANHIDRLPRPRPDHFDALRVRWAAVQSDPVHLEVLLDAGAARPTFTSLEPSPAFVDVFSPSIAYPDELVTLKAPSDHRMNPPRFSLLHDAAQAGALACVQLLLERGANPRARDALGRTPLHVAAEYGRSDVVEALVRVAPWDGAGISPARLAAYGGFARCVEMVADRASSDDVAAGIAASVPDDAADACAWAMVAAGAQPPEASLARAASRGLERTVLAAMDAGCDAPPLEAAIRGGSVSIVRRMVFDGSAGADDAVRLAAAWNAMDILEDIIEMAGANIARVQDVHGMDAVHVAAYFGRLDAVQLLMRHLYASSPWRMHDRAIAWVDAWGTTRVTDPLYRTSLVVLACTAPCDCGEDQRPDMVRWLFEAGICDRRVASEGRTLAEEALGLGRCECARVCEGE